MTVGRERKNSVEVSTFSWNDDARVVPHERASPKALLVF